MKKNVLMIWGVFVCAGILLLWNAGIPPFLTFWEVCAQTSPAILQPDHGQAGGPLTASQYVVVREAMDWTQAKAYAESYAPDKKSHLATIANEAEWALVCQTLDQAYGGAQGYVWLGGYSDEEGTFHWVTDEPFDYANWYTNEPSFHDLDNTRESCLCTWNIGGTWTWNDQRDNLASVLQNPESVLGMVVEYYEEAQ